MIASVSSRALLAALLLTACGRKEATRAPPPLPEIAKGADEVVEPTAVAAVEPLAPTAVRTPRSPPSSIKPERAPRARRSKATGAAYVPPAHEAPIATPAPAPAPIAHPDPAPAPVAKPKTQVTIPRTQHVRVELPAGLQADLDADPRMQPWVNKVIAVADGCHARARSNVGTVETVITMHEEARPDVDVRSLPSPLGGLVACATGALLRTKMPLFTGREGTRYPVRIVFE